jgi:hypothetical protein
MEIKHFSTMGLEMRVSTSAWWGLGSHRVISDNSRALRESTVGGASEKDLASWASFGVVVTWRTKRELAGFWDASKNVTVGTLEHTVITRRALGVFTTVAKVAGENCTIGACHLVSGTRGALTEFTIRSLSHDNTSIRAFLWKFVTGGQFWQIGTPEAELQVADIFSSSTDVIDGVGMASLQFVVHNTIVIVRVEAANLDSSIDRRGDFHSLVLVIANLFATFNLKRSRIG